MRPSERCVYRRGRSKYSPFDALLYFVATRVRGQLRRDTPDPDSFSRLETMDVCHTR